ncbi:hypothetical protein [Flavivirga algicola]|uniref:Uncharacterized protein n=1 Tax=Flavivirga algicola TaxID=2729136 RepID=A0ABX1S2P8_9FLAO|nr:hypothetical protein [Flavivirga algicola]NMH89019.1 hypothetical protein [Flavivirga algicola]
MNESETIKKIEDTLLKIANHKDNPDIVFIEIDTGGSEEGIIPYLNLYGNLILNQENLDNVIQKAIGKDEFGYIIDILDCVIWNDFEIEIPSLYPNWPNELEIGNLKIINAIKKTIDGNRKKFSHIRKLYFHYVDNFDFVKIIDKAA